MDYTTVLAEAMQTLEQRKDRRPNSREAWLDVQARALRQAFRRVYSAIRAARQEVQQ